MKNADLKHRIIELSYKHKLSHLGSCLTAVDIIDEIYQKKKPWEKFVLSSGHAHLAHLVVMEKYSQMPSAFESYSPDIEFLLKEYGIHCDRKAGCDASTGSLGQGLTIAVGMAFADRTKNVYCLISDGECVEGVIYEALVIATTQHLDNLKIYCNANGYAAYRKVSSFGLENLLHFKARGIKMVQTNLFEYPKWLQGQVAHYKTLNEEEYKELMGVLK